MNIAPASKHQGRTTKIFIRSQRCIAVRRPQGGSHFLSRRDISTIARRFKRRESCAQCPVPGTAEWGCPQSAVPAYRLTGVVHQLYPSLMINSEIELVNNSATPVILDSDPVTNTSLKCAPTLKSHAHRAGPESDFEDHAFSRYRRSTSRSIRIAAFILDSVNPQS